MKDQKPPGYITERVLRICTSSESVSSLIANESCLKPGHAWECLYGGWKSTKSAKWSSWYYYQPRAESSTAEELEKAAECGKWGPTKPSELFLKIYHDAVCTLDQDPLRAMVSPSLMGSCGVVPLTIISVIPDIARHMSNLIARAESEVYLATNYWQDSIASRFITNAIRELDRRAGKRGTKVVMKIIYDRGSPRQLFEPRYYVPEREYSGKNVRLPASHEIPNVDLQVINFHAPIMGTFHAKYMVVDRKIGILQSNNIQDNDNLEMMIHLEGLIVDSLYDMALISWHKRLTPTLPSHDMPAALGGLGSWPGEAVRDQTDGKPSDFQNGTRKRRGEVPELPVESRDWARADVLTGPSTTNSTIRPHPERSSPQTDTAGSSQTRSDTPDGATDEQTECYLRQGEQALPESRVRHPSPGLHDTPLPEHTTETPQYDDDIAGEVARTQTAVSPKQGETREQAVARLLNHSTSPGFEGNVAPECPPGEEMTPYIAHSAHEPFPMALVNRSPYGPPNHKSVWNPQNAAWLSALRNAQRTVFIQTPTLNAKPLIPAIREACERGVDVYCYVCLGYNDGGELLPRQGGHNEMVAHKLYQSLSPGGRDHLHYFWYVAKDQTRPLVQSTRKRSCHVKVMIVDEHVAIMGNGNQDTQSWFHSQEINVMLDSAEVCRAWIDGLRRNQNTHVYGALGKDGVWRDADGEEAEGVVGVDPGQVRNWAKGFVDAIKRVRGTGGF